MYVIDMIIKLLKLEVSFVSQFLLNFIFKYINWYHIKLLVNLGKMYCVFMDVYLTNACYEALHPKKDPVFVTAGSSCLTVNRWDKAGAKLSWHFVHGNILEEVFSFSSSEGLEGQGLHLSSITDIIVGMEGTVFSESYINKVNKKNQRYLKWSYISNHNALCFHYENVKYTN